MQSSLTAIPAIAWLYELRARRRRRPRQPRRVQSLASVAIEVMPEVEFLPQHGFESTAQDYKFRRFVDDR